MIEDSNIKAEIETAFKSVPRPDAFTVADGDLECMDCDRLFHAHTRETLPIEPFLDIAMSPLYELLPEGMKYYLPTLVGFALSTPSSQFPYAWAGESLLYKLRDARFIQTCASSERDAIINFLLHLRKTRFALLDDFCLAEDFDSVCDLWRQAS